MGEAKRRKLAGVSCGCGNGTRFFAEWYPNETTHIQALVMQRNKKMYVIRPSIVSTPINHSVTTAKKQVWVRKCAVCNKIDRISPFHRVLPYEVLAGFWEFAGIEEEVAIS